MNWGSKIILSFVTFAVGITVIVVMSMSANVDLVNEKYYEQEIRYQKQIDILEKSGSLNSELSVSQDRENIILNIKNTGDYKELSGKINFYRSSDASRDYTVYLMVDGDGSQIIPKNDMVKGSWKVKIEITGDGEDYYVEKNLFIN